MLMAEGTRSEAKIVTAAVDPAYLMLISHTEDFFTRVTCEAGKSCWTSGIAADRQASGGAGAECASGVRVCESL